MPTPNVVLLPNKPVAVTPAMWWFVSACMRFVSGTLDGGTITNKPGSHNTRNRLIAQKLYNDYSIRDPLNKEGPGDMSAAWDWTFPTAQRSNYVLIVMIMDRIEAAYHARDPRTYGLFEVLGQADFDTFAEGFVFYPIRRTRTPDGTHLWHIHWGFIRKFLNDFRFFRGLFSLVRGLTYNEWVAEEGGGVVALTEDAWRQVTLVQMGRDFDGWQDAGPHPSPAWAKEGGKYSNAAVESRLAQQIAAVGVAAGAERGAIINGVVQSVLAGVEALLKTLDLELNDEQLAKLTDAIIQNPNNPTEPDDAQLVADLVVEKLGQKLTKE